MPHCRVLHFIVERAPLNKEEESHKKPLAHDKMGFFPVGD